MVLHFRSFLEIKYYYLFIDVLSDSFILMYSKYLRFILSFFFILIIFYFPLILSVSLSALRLISSSCSNLNLTSFLTFQLIIVLHKSRNFIFIFFIRLPPRIESLRLNQLSGVGVYTMSWHTPCFWWLKGGLWLGTDTGWWVECVLRVGCRRVGERRVRV